MRFGSVIAKLLSANASGMVSRFMGGFGSGPPSTGSYQVNDFITDARGFMWLCTSTGTPGTWERIGRNGFFYTREYGIKFDGASDSTTLANNQAGWNAIAAAIQAVATPGLKAQGPTGQFQAGSQLNGGGSALCDPGLSQVGYIQNAHRMLIQGHGLGTTIMQAAGQNAPLITNRRDGTVHAKGCTVRDIQLHGNDDNQTNPNDLVWWNGDTTNTYNDTKDEDYDERHALINVNLIKAKGALVRMTGAGRNLLFGVTGRNSGREGVYSFQDNNLVNVDIGWAGWMAFDIVGDDNRGSDLKGWYSGQSDPTKGQGMVLNADSAAFAGISFQDNAAQGLLLDGAYGADLKGVMCDSNSKSSAGTYAQISVFNSQNNSLSATVRNRYNAGGPGTVALEVAGSGPTPLQNDIHINPGTGVWGVTTLLKSGSNVSGNEVVFGSNGKGWQSIPYAATVTLNPLLGSKCRFAPLTGNLTLANPSWAYDGAELELRIPQDATGSRTLSLGTAWDPSISTAFSTTANAVNIIRCRYSSASSLWERWN